MPYAKYVELWNRAFPDKKLQAKPPITAWSLAGAAYEATLSGDDYLLVTGRLEIDVYTEQPVQVPLRLSGGVLTSAMIDGKPARLQLIQPAPQPANGPQGGVQAAQPDPQQQAVQAPNPPPQQAQAVQAPAPDAVFAVLHLAGKGRQQLALQIRMHLERRGGWRRRGRATADSSCGRAHADRAGRSHRSPFGGTGRPQRIRNGGRQRADCHRAGGRGGVEPAMASQGRRRPGGSQLDRRFGSRAGRAGRRPAAGLAVEPRIPPQPPRRLRGPGPRRLPGGESPGRQRADVGPQAGGQSPTAERHAAERSRGPRAGHAALVPPRRRGRRPADPVPRAGDLGRRGRPAQRPPDDPPQPAVGTARDQRHGPVADGHCRRRGQRADRGRRRRGKPARPAAVSGLRVRRDLVRAGAGSGARARRRPGDAAKSAADRGTGNAAGDASQNRRADQARPPRAAVRARRAGGRTSRRARRIHLGGDRRRRPAAGVRLLGLRPIAAVFRRRPRVARPPWGRRSGARAEAGSAGRRPPAGRPGGPGRPGVRRPRRRPAGLRDDPGQQYVRLAAGRTAALGPFGPPLPEPAIRRPLRSRAPHGARQRLHDHQRQGDRRGRRRDGQHRSDDLRRRDPRSALHAAGVDGARPHQRSQAAAEDHPGCGGRAQAVPAGTARRHPGPVSRAGGKRSRAAERRTAGIGIADRADSGIADRPHRPALRDAGECRPRRNPGGRPSRFGTAGPTASRMAEAGRHPGRELDVGVHRPSRGQESSS